MAYPGFRHLGLKLVSITLAALLWLVVSGEQVVERALRIPLEFTNLPPTLELVGDTPTVVDVRVRGSSGTLSRIAPGELVAVLDLRAARAGRRLFHLTASDVRQPFGVEVVQVNPSNVSVTFDHSGTKVVPVVPSVEGDPAPAFVVGTVTAEPSTVEVVGPISALNTLTEAITEPISIAGASAPVQESVNVGVPDPSIRLLNPQSATVRVDIRAAPEEQTIAGVPVQVRRAKGPVQLMPPRVTVHLSGAGELLDRAASALEAAVDVEGLQPGQYQLPVRVSPPAGVRVLRVEPTQVRVRIR